jgi:hypothetical protein
MDAHRLEAHGAQDLLDKFSMSNDQLAFDNSLLK